MKKVEEIHEEEKVEGLRTERGRKPTTCSISLCEGDPLHIHKL